MIVYNGSLELCINNKALVFFLKPFPVGWVLGFQRNRVRLLHLKVARLYAAPLLWITWRKNFIRWHTGSDRTQAEQCVTPLKPTTTKKKPMGCTEGIHIYTRFSSGGGKQLLAVWNVWGWINRMNGLNYVIAGSEIISQKIDKSAAGKYTPTTSFEGEWQVLSSTPDFRLPAHSNDILIPGLSADSEWITDIIFFTRVYMHTQTLPPIGQ